MLLVFCCISEWFGDILWFFWMLCDFLGVVESLICLLLLFCYIGELLEWIFELVVWFDSVGCL